MSADLAKMKATRNRIPVECADIDSSFAMDLIDVLVAAESEITILRQCLKIAVKEADDWHDEARGGPVPAGLGGGNKAFDTAREISER